jgi:hypothetical protein
VSTATTTAAPEPATDGFDWTDVPAFDAGRGQRWAGAGRALAFAGLSALLVGHWAALIAEPPVARLVLAVPIALALGAVLARLGAGSAGTAPHPRQQATAATVTAVALIAGVVTVGVPLAQLLPGGWGELGANVDEGLAGLSGRPSYPVETDVVWARLLLLVPVPLFVIGAAALAWWPPGPRPRRALASSRLPALIFLLAGYAVAVAANDGRREYGWGLAVLALIVLWLWAPMLRRAGPLLLVVAIAAVSVPLASVLRSERPWVDYSDWQIPAATEGTAFAWDHGYGPIDWPRTGDTLFRVRSTQPRYWRAALLESFDGEGWRHEGGGGPAVPGSIPSPAELAASPPEIEQADVSVVALESELVVSPGTPLFVQGISGAERRPDGSMVSESEPLTRDTSYTVNAYVPDPGAAQLRAASRAYPPALSPYTELTLPLRPRLALTPTPVPTDLPVPLFGSEISRAPVESAIDASVYREVGELARRLTAGEPTAYDATKAIEAHLRDTYDYDEEPPLRRFPLAAFIGGDRAGYCQQFSGSMALMLRMVGIPARVATGFTPGERRPEDRELFEVTDLDAHSWVEVFFNGIGWVPFDPTPSASPASAQSGGAGVVSAAIGAGSSPSLEPELSPGELQIPALGPGGEGGEQASDGPGAALVLAALAALAAAAAVLAIAARSARSRSLPAEELLERRIAELPGTLRGIGWPRPKPLTLLAIERRLETNRMSAAARYVAGLRDSRYSASAEPPAAAARRAARRELSRGRGVRARLRLWAAMPPGGPRRTRDRVHT